MDYTQNLNLPQFAETDRIHHDDFNEAFDKIDTALAGAGNCKLLTGVYIGTGVEPRTIDLGITPKAVMIWMGGTTQHSSIPYGGVAVTGHNSPGITITGNGFTVFFNNGAYTNAVGSTYFYIVLY